MNGIHSSTNIYSEPDLIRKAYSGELLPVTQVDVFRNAHLMFPVRTVCRGTSIRPLEKAGQTFPEFRIDSRGGRYDLFDYISRNRVSGLLVLKAGRVVFEYYDFGNNAATRWLSMSMAKSISTTLVGVAIRDGAISSVDEPVTAYLPQLIGTGYDDVTIRHVLQMTSGLQWNDSHADPNSERRQMLELQIAQRSDAILQYVASRPRFASPGEVWNYSTGETHVVGALLRAATGRWAADYLAETIWSKLGMESDATWWLEAPGGLEVAGSGFSATLRDYGRFGLFVLNDGVIGGTQVLPQGWIQDAGAPRLIAGKRVDYGYMWWPVASQDKSFSDHAFSARGIFGQFMYLNCRRQVVVVVWSARSKPKDAEAILDNDFFNTVAENLDG